MDRKQSPSDDRGPLHDDTPHASPGQPAAERTDDEVEAPDWAPETEGALSGMAVGIGTGTGAAAVRPERREENEAATRESSDPRTR